MAEPPCLMTLKNHKTGLQQLPVILKSHKPIDMITIMLGTNDLKDHLGLQLGESGRSIHKTIELIKSDEMCL